MPSEGDRASAELGYRMDIGSATGTMNIIIKPVRIGSVRSCRIGRGPAPTSMGEFGPHDDLCHLGISSE